MNYGPIVFLAAFLALAGSWFGLVLTPQMQVGQLQQTNTLVTTATYPLARPGLAHEGLGVYRANGCAYCHSQQVRQTGTVCDVLLTGAGTNHSALVAAIVKVKTGLTEAQAEQLLTGLPKPLLQGVTRETADATIKTLTTAGAKSELWIRPVGPDIDRGWGKRRTVAEDFLFDSPVMLGSQQIGPDLANIGSRQPDPNWQLRHLYAPKSEIKDSPMPPYPFLFERRRIERTRSPEALDLPPAFAPPSGYEIVPTREAKALAAYLTSLRADAPLFPVPMTVASAPAPSTTNSPATGVEGPNQAPNGRAAGK
jgi:cbb3-type cytochrome oxidase cytochrome c subunit